jgi:pimeloyl-ACP methyl ester carboxylesterase
MLLRSILSLALMTTATEVAAQTPAQTEPAASVTYSRPPAPGQLVDIGGRKLHVLCKGPEKGRVVLFEAGLSQFTASSTYGRAQDLIAADTRVCLYDRAGLGWSDPAPDPRTHRDMVNDLRALSKALRIKRPVVLVGHSMGGLIARLYAHTYPRDVAAVILVEATPEQYLFTEGNVAARKAIVAQIKQGLAKASGDQPVVPMAAGTPGDVQLAFTPTVLRTVRQEYQAIDLAPAAMRPAGGYGHLGKKPLIVIRRGKTASPPSDADRNWQSLQESLLALSSNSKLIVAEKAGHVVPYDQPEIIAAAVREILAKQPK